MWPKVHGHSFKSLNLGVSNERHIKTFWTSVHFQSCGNSLPKALRCSCMAVHRARYIITSFDGFGLEEFELPAQSPDLNPIRHFFGMN